MEHITITLSRVSVTVGHYSLMTQPRCGTCHYSSRIHFRRPRGIPVSLKSHGNPLITNYAFLGSWHSQKTGRFLWGGGGNLWRQRFRQSQEKFVGYLLRNPNRALMGTFYFTVMTTGSRYSTLSICSCVGTVSDRRVAYNNCKESCYLFP